MNDNKGGIVVAAIAIIVLGILLRAGVIGDSTGLIGKIVHIGGIMLIAGGIIMALLVVGVIIASMVSKNTDETQGTKNEINQIITKRRQELAKMKSTSAVMSMELRNAKNKLEAVDQKIAACEKKAKQLEDAGDVNAAELELSKKSTYLRERQIYSESYENYLSVVHDAEKKIMEIEEDLLSMQQRSGDAFAKIKKAEMLTNDQEIVDDLAHKAQYQEDYAEAMKKLQQ